MNLMTREITSLPSFLLPIDNALKNSECGKLIAEHHLLLRTLINETDKNVSGGGDEGI